MSERKVDRRTALKLATAFAATGLSSCAPLAQQGSGSRGAGALPARGEFVIRGATVLTLDGKIGDLARGDVDGRILRRAGEFTALDYAEVLAQAGESAASLRKRANWP